MSFIENILCVTHEGNRIKIIDFGLARKYDPDKKLQVSYLVVGKKFILYGFGLNYIGENVSGKFIEIFFFYFNDTLRKEKSHNQKQIKCTTANTVLNVRVFLIHSIQNEFQ